MKNIRYLSGMQHISNYLFFVPPIAAGVAFLASLTIFFLPPLPKERYLRYFSYFLLADLLMETGATYLSFATMNNLFATNIETMLTISFELFLIREIIFRRLAKQIVTYIVFLYPLAALANILYIQRGAFHTITYSLGSLLIVAGCIYYFLEQFQQTSSFSLSRQPAFWICSGLLFYYTCTFPVLGFIKLMELLPSAIVENLTVILDVLDILLYLSFTIAFLCRFKTTRKSMSSF